MIQIKVRRRSAPDKGGMVQHHLFRDISMVTAIKLAVIFAAGWLVFGQPLKVDAGATQARLMGAPNSLSKGIAP